VTVSGAISILPVTGLPEIEQGADLASMILDAAGAAGVDVADDDVVVITSKIVSKAEGASIDLDQVSPSEFATRWALEWEKDPRVVEVVLRESRRVVRQIGPVLITETHHGFICANSGVDQSSSGAMGRVVVLPVDPDASARRIRERFAELGVRVGVVISDTFGRPWREGQTDICIGLAGIAPMRSYIGEVDPHGHEFRVQELCVVDEIAAAAELVKGNTSRIPVAVLRGVDHEVDEAATMAPVLRDTTRDLFR
jgi:coenzyme F420-0:L-glutamate ligase/coenzyme F420-1:gamma-L-glutamate ligase